VFALSLGSIAGYCRFVRAELCEVMSSEYLLLARTKGLTKRQAILRHALRNAMVPIVPSILAEFLSIMGGSMILENLYGIPGIGTLFVEALNGKDYSVLFVDMAIFTTFGLLAGVLLDISYGFIDPRIRMGAKK
jgi:ABC-type dipeptide/oligopeptide/nickel transport system permease component